MNSCKSRILKIGLSFPRQFLYVWVFNTLIALLLTMITGNAFLINLLISYCIGFSSLASFNLFRRFVELRTVNVLLPLLIGSVVGLGLALGILMVSNNASYTQLVAAVIADYRHLLANLVIGVIFGLMIVYFFVSYTRISEADSALKAAQIDSLHHEKSLMESQLKLLQAQVEPHFLYNSLSNIHSLVDSDPHKGKQMLADLTRYLRASLDHSRAQETTLGQELDIVSDYLAIFQIRMGARLRFAVDATDEARRLPFPPMLVQPLVENAIKHGLEPASDGGRVEISAVLEPEMLRISVRDTGLGLQAESGSGFGLSNIQQRLAHFFEGRGRLSIVANSPRGVHASIEVARDGL